MLLIAGSASDHRGMCTLSAAYDPLLALRALAADVKDLKDQLVDFEFGLHEGLSVGALHAD